MRHLASSLCSLGLGFSALCHSVFAEDAVAPRSQHALIFRTSSSVDSHFAVAIRGESLAASLKRHVILVDTSASQTGVYRKNSQQILKSLVERLPADNSVMLVAVDTEYVQLTEGFVSADSSELKAAIDGLKKRTPMGSTDLHAAIRKSFADQPLSPMSMLYIGDGMSPANRLSVNELDQLVDDLQNRQIAFHAVLMGPRVDVELPGVLVNQTGGTLERSNVVDVAATSQRLAQELAVAPTLVGDLKASGNVTVVGNERIALRPDRETIVPGKGPASEGFRLSAKTNDGKTLTWSADAADIRTAGAEVRMLFERASATGGLNTSLVGVEGLEAAGKLVESSVAQSVALANRLDAAGKKAEAREVARQAKLIDAANPILTTLAAGLLDETAPAAQDVSTPPVPNEAGDDQLGPPSGDEGDQLSKAQARAEILTQQLVQSTSAAIEEAKRTAGEQPEYALTLLKDVLDTIRASQEVAPEKREELERRVIDAYARVNETRLTNEIAKQESAQKRANQEQIGNLLEASRAEEQRLQTLIAQVRGSLERARRGDVNSFEEAESTARIALDLKPGNGTATAAVVMAEAGGQLSKAYRLVNLRHDRFLATLYQVELSHVPFPDEPPVQYPPADVWRALTLARRERYQSVSLQSQKPVEEWLEKMLEEPIPTLDFGQNASLREILDQIETHFNLTGEYNMRIILDESDPDIGEDPEYLENTTVQGVNLKGISLRNALVLILAKVKDQELTYLIENEVMKITTVATAELPEKLVTRVYDVGDLVVQTIPMGGGGQQGGGFGGGQQGGGFGGGQQGGGFGGGGGGFGGGNMFSVPAEDLKPNDGIKLNGADAKKKPAK